MALSGTEYFIAERSQTFDPFPAERISLVETWLNQCLSTHIHCKPSVDYYPTDY